MAPKSKANLVSSSTGNPSPSSIIWPLFDPPSSQQQLQLTTILPDLHTIHSLFSPAALKRWSTFLNSPSTPIKLSSSPAPKRGEAHRTNHRFSIIDPAFARCLWEESGLKDVLNGLKLDGVGGGTQRKPVGLYENIRLYRYSEGEFFGRAYSILCSRVLVI